MKIKIKTFEEKPGLWAADLIAKKLRLTTSGYAETELKAIAQVLTCMTWELIDRGNKVE